MSEPDEACPKCGHASAGPTEPPAAAPVASPRVADPTQATWRDVAPVFILLAVVLAWYAVA